MAATNHASRIHFLDRDSDSAGPFVEELRRLGTVETHATLDSLLRAGNNPDSTLIIDLETLLQSPSSRVGQILEMRGRVPIGLVAGCPLEQYIPDVRRLGILQIAIKTPPLASHDIALYLNCLRAPAEGFGLMRYMTNTVEIHNLNVVTAHEKTMAIERATNHFATIGFDVHELYDVRLALEEMANNSIYHAFQTPDGKEKYNIRTFKELESGESVRIEYGSDGGTAGFSVSDNAGTLGIKTILSKIERQHNREGLYDESGRGLYLTRMLSTQMVFNIEAGRRTQILVLFDERRRTDRPKPLIINYVGPDTIREWGTDPDFD